LRQRSAFILSHPSQFIGSGDMECCVPNAGRAQDFTKSIGFSAARWIAVAEIDNIDRHYGPQGAISLGVASFIE
jgi:hypothetical protein